MPAKAKKRYAILFFLLPKKTKDKGLIKEKRTLKRAKQWICGGLLILLVAIVAVYLKNNHEFVIDISNTVSEYLKRYKHPNATSNEICHIGFLKVHKAGGSTVQNILFRFGLKRHLSFIMPITEYKFSTYGDTRAKIFINKKGQYDILALHSVYNESIYSQVLPNDTVNIAIVREPLSLMISGAYYHRDVWQVQYLQGVPRDKYIQNLIRYPELYDPQEFSLTKNSMAMDFGFPLGFHVTDTHKLNDHLRYLETKFRLVMVVEYFDESLVLLKRMLHWTLEDILYIPVNEYKHPSEKDLNISVIDKQKFEDRNFLDVAIYRFFYQKYIQMVSVLGSDFQKEVDHFKTIRKTVEDHCVFHENGDILYEIKESRWNDYFVILQNDCDAMLTPELTFIDQIRAHIQQKVL